MSNQSAKTGRPSLIGRYEIVKRIGSGGMGTVYQAIHLDLGRRVALKVLPAELAAKPDMLERFRHEARHAAKLRHENIVTLYEFDESGGTHFLAMEYVEGCNLHEYIDKKGKVDPEEARKLTIQGAKALAAAHAHNIVHRDIKPSNFLLAQKDGHALVKLTDFGLARTIDDHEFKMTKTGTTVGTVDYISPEQARNSRAADIRSDIYSLGCTLYHMLAGRSPFSEGDMTERLLKHVDTKPEDIRVFNPTVPPGLAMVLDKMLEKKPEDRYQTPDELIAELENLPTGPPLSAREALEALAMASGEKSRASRKIAPSAETRKTPAATTQPLHAPLSGSDVKLHYRHVKKKKGRADGSKGVTSFITPFVVEGWGPRLMALGALAAICLLGLAIIFKWGGEPPAKKQKKDEEIAEAGKKDGKSTSNDSKKLAKANLEDIEKGSKKISDDLKSKLKERREDSDVAGDREALNQLSGQAKLDPIQMPGQNLLEDLRNEFKGNGTGSAKQNFAIIQNAYKNLAQGNIPSNVEPNQGGTEPPITIPGVTTPGPSGNTPPTNTQLPPNVQGLLSGQLPPNPAQGSQGQRQTAGGPLPGLDQGQKNSSGNAGGSSNQPSGPQQGSTTQSPKTSAGGEGKQQANSSSDGQAPATQKSALPGTSRGPTTGTGSQNQPGPDPQASRSQPPATGQGGSGASKPLTGALIDNQGPSTPQTAQGNEPLAPSVSPLYVVSRSSGTPAERRFDSVGTAIKTALAKETADTLVVEIQDNGPLFEKPIVVRGRNIVLRAARGFRPLIVWDSRPETTASSNYLISVVRGSLALVDVDVAARCSETTPSGMSGLARVESGDLLLVRSSFSVSGKNASGMAAVQLDGVKTDGTVCRCQLDRCVVRGGELTALDIRAPTADVVVEDSLLASGQRPLISVLGKNGSTPTSLRFRGCTLAAGQTLLRINPATLADTQPSIYWLCWDTLLARHGQSPSGEMIDLQDSGKIDGLRWKAVNCLYTGWQTLLHYAGGNVTYDNETLWRALLQQPQGDRISPQTWPTMALAEPGDAPLSFFQIAGAMRYASTYTRGNALGCDLSRMPPARDRWQAIAFDTVSVGELELPRVDSAPPFPAATDGKEPGKRLELTADFDLGDYLQKLHDQGKLAANVVYHLHGTGSVKTSPVRLKNTSLTLFVEANEGERLTLVPRGGGDRDALFDLQGGNLTLLGGAISFANAKDTPQPAYAIKIQNGDLHLSKCRLQGPMEGASASFRGLLRFDGGGETKTEGLPECVISDSVLLSGKACLQGQVVGSRLRFHGNLILSLADAFVFEAGAPVARLNAQCLLDNNTFAAQRSVVHIGDAASMLSPVQPMTLQAQANVFLDPFQDPLHQAGILLFEDQALAHGLLAWQGKGNAYDKQIDYYVGGVASSPGWKQSHSVGMRLLGLNRDEQPLLIELAAIRGFALDRPPLERLALPPTLVQQLKLPAPVGADFNLLGLAKRK